MKPKPKDPSRTGKKAVDVVTGDPARFNAETIIADPALRAKLRDAKEALAKESPRLGASSNNMTIYRSKEPIWVTPTGEIRALHGKELLVNEGGLPSGGRSYKLLVETADPAGPYAGKVSVSINYTIVVRGDWVPSDSSQTPKPSTAHGHTEFLSPAALDLIRPRPDEWPGREELWLALPGKAESSDRQ